MDDELMLSSLKSIFQENSSGLMVTGNDISQSAVTNGDTIIHTFPILKYEERIVSEDLSVSYIHLCLCSHGKISEVIRIKSETGFSQKPYTTVFGAKPFAEFRDEHWDMFFEVIRLFLRVIEQYTTYTFSGWTKGLDSFILGRLQINKTDIIPVHTTVAPGETPLSDKPINEIASCVDKIAANISQDSFTGYLMLMHHMLSYTKQLTLQTNNICPLFILSIVGKTSTYKTSTSSAMFNPIGITTCSFEDTPASICKVLRSNISGVTIIDDYKSQTKDNDVKYEKAIRLCGDVGTNGKTVIGNKVSDEAVTCMSVITGELRPKLQQSSYARILFIDLNDNPIDRGHLSQLQDSRAAYISFLAAFIQYMLQQTGFVKSFVSAFYENRNKLLGDAIYTGMHGRYYDMYGWLTSIWEIYVSFAENCGISIDYDFKSELKQRIYSQHCRYECDPVKLFARAYIELTAANKVITIIGGRANDVNFDVLDLGDELFVKSTSLYNKVCTYCQENGIDFSCSERTLRKLLDEKGLLHKEGKYLTFERKTTDNRSYSGYKLFKNLFKKYGGNGYEAF